MSILQKTLLDIVQKNYRNAQVLDSYGIEFYKYPFYNLQEVCELFRLDARRIAHYLQMVPDKSARLEEIGNLYHKSVAELVEYLKSTHRVFMRVRLPFLQKIITQIPTHYFDTPAVIEDLKFIFPIFAEDFVAHILEEEENTFGYILNLENALSRRFNALKIFEELSKHSIAETAHEHFHDIDDMAGIRELTNHYQTSPQSSLYTQLLYEELKSFETEIKIHSQIENCILFPKALALERKVKEWLQKFAELN
ncbi:MAG: hemerythrin HHE cation-binding protein [Cytophagales bacterium]|nr:hemerythrin HHE cation-binding protein [Cytophagales bacterium]MDW8383795.1 hemerythrin HHE cation-binding protein [Flammeovirgaceae bacterium]